MHNKKVWLTVALGCAIALLSLGTVKFKQISDAISLAAAYPEPVETVNLAVAATVQWQPKVTVSGELVAIQDIEVSIELPGRIVEVAIQPGQRVARDELLLKLDTRAEEADLLAAQADAKLAQLALSRNRRLAKTGAASAEALDRASAVYSSTRARVEGLRAVIDKKTLRAPFDGRVGLHQLSIGQYLDAGTVITRLIGTDRGVWVDFTLPQHQATLIEGDSVRIDAPRLLAGSAAAVIIARDAWVDVASRHVRYRALPTTDSGALYPGAIISVTVALGEARTATAVPVSAVRRDPYGAYVFVLVAAEEDALGADRAERRAVVVGGERNQRAIIIEGLAPGERIAGDGAFKLREGVLVNAVAATHGDHEASEP